jgi:histidine ammonia-lyase
MRRDIENELNSANDNPIVDPEAELILHGGHFYGGHIAFAMDALKAAAASVADLLDRQLALLVDAKFNAACRRTSPEPRPSARHQPRLQGGADLGFGLDRGGAEAHMPAASFSRSTESHNQDKVSMGSIAARDCLRVLTLTEQVAAAHLLATQQAVLAAGGATASSRPRR